MKTFLKILAFSLLVLIAIVLINTFTATSVQPEPFNEEPPTVPETAIDHLSLAIQFPTIAHKIEMMDREAFDGLLQFIDSTYLLFSSATSKTIVSSHTLLYRWEGSEPGLEPNLFMGHMDVVPIEAATRDKWDYSPFSGAVDNGFINGRGSLDDKNTVIGLLEAAEMLIKKGFKPKRTIYFLFGQDEEIGGHEGARLVVEKFVREGTHLNMVWDEGTIIGKELVPGMENEVALIGIAEKGYVSFELHAEVEGGHSSMPASSNSIGDLSTAIAKLQENPFPFEIAAPVEGFIEYLGPEMPFVNRMAFSNTWLFEPMIINTYASNENGRALIHTTMAPTIFKAGIKDNVIPTSAKAVVNCRILPGHDVEETKARIEAVINNPNIRVTPQETQQNPSKSTDYNSTVFRTICSSVRTVYPESRSAPFLMLGATDSRHFEPVCEHIIKFAPFVYESEDLPRLHGINERIHVDNFKKGIQIYCLAIENLDE